MSQNTKPVGPAVKVLISQVLQRFQAENEQLAQIALQDAGLDPADGWRFDIFNAQFVQQPVQQEQADTAKE